jgi:hypothetical protein
VHPSLSLSLSLIADSSASNPPDIEQRRYYSGIALLAPIDSASESLPAFKSGFDPIEPVGGLFLLRRRFLFFSSRAFIFITAGVSASFTNYIG